MQSGIINVDPALAEDAQAVFHELGTSLFAAVSVFLRQTVRDHALPIHAEPEEFTDEELAEAYRRGMAQIEAGHCVHVTMEELERMANE